MASKTNSKTVALPQSDRAQLAKNVNTRLTAKSDKVQTALTVIFDSEELTREFAMRGAVIAVQALWRASGKIPTSETISLTELKKRSAEAGFARKPTADSTAAAIRKLDDAAYESVLKNLGMRDADIKKLIAARKTA